MCKCVRHWCLLVCIWNKVCVCACVFNPSFAPCKLTKTFVYSEGSSYGVYYCTFCHLLFLAHQYKSPQYGKKLSFYFYPFLMFLVLICVLGSMYLCTLLGQRCDMKSLNWFVLPVLSQSICKTFYSIEISVLCVIAKLYRLITPLWALKMNCNDHMVANW